MSDYKLIGHNYQTPDIDPSQLVFISEYCGGGFGSKAVGAVSMSIPAMLSKKTRRPVMKHVFRSSGRRLRRNTEHSSITTFSRPSAKQCSARLPNRQ